MDQHLDVIGQVADADNPFVLSLEVIDTISVKFNATSQSQLHSALSKKTPVFNRGTSLSASNAINVSSSSSSGINK